MSAQADPLSPGSADLGVRERIAYLDRCLQLVPLAEEPWLELARMAREGVLAGSFRPVVTARLAALTRTFGRYPDFIARLSDDLVTAESTTGKLQHYQRTYLLHEKAGRADLACRTALKIARLQQEQKRYRDAVGTLSVAVRKFPVEGRYIPELLNACEEMCGPYPQGVPALGKLYVDLTPVLVQHDRGEKNPFLEKVLTQATGFFTENKLSRLEATFKSRLAQAQQESSR